MPITNPEEVLHAFFRAFNQGDIDAVIALYEPQAALVAQPGQVAEAALLRSLGPLRGPCFRRCFYKFSRRYMRMSSKLGFLHWRFFRVPWMFLILF